jgi:cyclic-di-GMP-binding protein
MASEHSMDTGVSFDFQEMKNAIDQTKREALNRFDLKDSNIEIELTDDNVKITAQSNNQIEAVFGIVIKKMIGRNLSPKILDRKPIEEIGGMRVKQEIRLIKALDSENTKKISKIIRESFPKVKVVILGETLRITSKSIDELQEIIAFLREEKTINLPLDFSNFR